MGTWKPASKTDRNFIDFYNSPFDWWYINWDRPQAVSLLLVNRKNAKQETRASESSNARLYHRLLALLLAARTSRSQSCSHTYNFQSEKWTQILQHLRFRDHDTINYQKRTPFFPKISIKLKHDSCISVSNIICHKDLFPVAYLYRTPRSWDTSIESKLNVDLWSRYVYCVVSICRRHFDLAHEIKIVAGRFQALDRKPVHAQLVILADNVCTWHAHTETWKQRDKRKKNNDLMAFYLLPDAWYEEIIAVHFGCCSYHRVPFKTRLCQLLSWKVDCVFHRLSDYEGLCFTMQHRTRNMSKWLSRVLLSIWPAFISQAKSCARHSF